MKKLNVAVIGYGRSGCDIHCNFFKSEQNDIVNVVAVVELDPKRAAVAKSDFGCDTYSDYKELFGRVDIDLVVNSSYSHMHYPITLDLLNHGFNVVCEKPLCRTAQEVQDLIDAAKKNNVVFTIFQQSRLAPYFKKLEEVLKSGVLGKINCIRAYYGGFSRRYDWQTLIRYNAGNMRNTGPHPFEQILHLADTDEMPEIFSKLAIVNSVGDAEDYVKAILTYPNTDKPLFEIEINPADPFNEYLYRVYGNRGALTLTAKHIKYQYYLEEESPQPKLIVESLHKEDGSPAYCSDTIKWHEVEEDIVGDAFNNATCEYYQRLYDHMVNGGELFIKPEKIKIEIAVFEEISRQNPLEQKF